MPAERFSRCCMRLLLHCGAHKTATTLIQGVLDGVSDQLLKAGIGYIHPTEINNAGVLRFNHNPSDPTRAEVDEMRRFFDGVFERQRASTYLISHESFFSFANLNGQPRNRQFYGDCEFSIGRFADLGIFDSITAIYYIRRQDGFLNSIYLEYVKVGYIEAAFKDFLCSVDLERLSWKAIVDRLEASFGRERVELRLFDDIRAGTVPYIQGFLETIGVGDRVKLGPIEEKNRSFSALALEMALRCYPLLMNLADKRKMARFLQVHYSNRDYPAARLVSKELKERILDLHREDNLSLFRSYFPGRSRDTEFAKG